MNYEGYKEAINGLSNTKAFWELEQLYMVDENYSGHDSGPEKLEEIYDLTRLFTDKASELVENELTPHLNTLVGERIQQAYANKEFDISLGDIKSSFLYMCPRNDATSFNNLTNMINEFCSNPNTVFAILKARCSLATTFQKIKSMTKKIGRIVDEIDADQLTLLVNILQANKNKIIFDNFSDDEIYKLTGEMAGEELISHDIDGSLEIPNLGLFTKKEKEVREGTDSNGKKIVIPKKVYVDYNIDPDLDRIINRSDD